MKVHRKKITFTSAGHQLAGLLELPTQNIRGYALFAHCFTCGKDILAASRISKRLVESNFAVLRFDFTGLGSSEGDFANTNYSSNVDDLIAAADFLREEYEAPSLLIGHSLGGRAVLSAVQHIPETKAVVTIGAPADANHVVKQFVANIDDIKRNGETEVSLAGRPFKIKQQFLDDVEGNRNDIEQLRVPLLILHSPVDTTVAIHQAEKIYSRAKHPKSFISLDKADHLLSYKDDANYVATVVASWATKYIAVEQTSAKVVKVNKGEVHIGESNQRFTRAVHTDTHQWLVDEPVGIGDGLGPDPYEHLLVALGSCTSMTLRMYANRKKIPLADINITLRHFRQHGDDCQQCDEQHPQVDVIERDIELIGEALTNEQRQSLLRIADRCPVHKTLENKLDIRSRLQD